MHNSDMIFRRCVPEDIDRVMELQDDAFASLEDQSMLRRNSREMLLECLSPPHCALCMDSGDKLTALGILYHGGRSPENLARLMDIPAGRLELCDNIKLVIVRSGSRGRGLGCGLIIRLEREAVLRGRVLLCATVSPRNAPSLANFERLGYKAHGVYEKYGGLERLLLYKYIAVGTA